VCPKEYTGLASHHRCGTGIRHHYFSQRQLFKREKPFYITNHLTPEITPLKNPLNLKYRLGTNATRQTTGIKSSECAQAANYQVALIILRNLSAAPCPPRAISIFITATDRELELRRIA